MPGAVKGTAADVQLCAVSYVVDFVNVSTIGLESSPVAAALAGLRAHEARYFKNKYDHRLHGRTGRQGEEDHRLGASHPQRGARHRRSLRLRLRRRPRGREHPMALRVLRERALDQRRVRARRPEEASSRFQALRRNGDPRRAWLVQIRARQKSKLAGTIRGSYFVDQGRVLSPSNLGRDASAMIGYAPGAPHNATIRGPQSGTTESSCQPKESCSPLLSWQDS